MAPSSLGHRPYLSSPRSQLWKVLVGIRRAYTCTVLPDVALLLPSLQRRLWKLRKNLPDLIADKHRIRDYGLLTGVTTPFLLIRSLILLGDPAIPTGAENRHTHRHTHRGLSTNPSFLSVAVMWTQSDQLPHTCDTMASLQH